MPVTTNLTFDQILSSSSAGALGRNRPIHEDLPDPIRRSQLLGNDTLQYIEASERTIFEPELHQRYLQMALQLRKDFNDLSQRDSHTETKIFRAINRLETIKKSHAGILQGIEYVEKKGRVTHGTMSDCAAPDVFTLITEAHSLKVKIHADRQVYSRDLNDPELAPLRVLSHLQSLDTRARSAVEIAIAKNYIKEDQIKELLKSEEPQAVWEYISSKVRELIKLRELPNTERLADRLTSNYLMPMRDKIHRHTEGLKKLKSQEGKTQLVGNFQDMLESLQSFFLHGEWETSDVQSSHSTSAGSVSLASAAVEVDPEKSGRGLPSRSAGELTSQLEEMAIQMQQLSSKRAEELGSLAVEFECLNRHEFVQIKNSLNLSSRDIHNAAEQGNAVAQTIIGNIYAGALEGGEEKISSLQPELEKAKLRERLATAAKWYTKAALQDNMQDSADAQFHLGEMYESGIGVERNRTIAAEWYAKAAEKGHAHAEFNLNEMRQLGLV